MQQVRALSSACGRMQDKMSEHSTIAQSVSLLDAALELGIYAWNMVPDHLKVFQDLKGHRFQSSKTIARNYTACEVGTYSHVFEIAVALQIWSGTKTCTVEFEVFKFSITGAG